MSKIIKETLILFICGSLLASIGMILYPHHNLIQYLIILVIQIIVWMFAKNFRINRK